MSLESELRTQVARILAATHAKDLFGTLRGGQKDQTAGAFALFTAYQRTLESFRQVTGDIEESESAEQQLITIWREALRLISLGTYPCLEDRVPDRTDTFAVNLGGQTFSIIEKIAVGDIADVFLCVNDVGRRAILKVAHQNRDADVFTREVTSLRFAKANEKYGELLSKYTPGVIDTFKVDIGGGETRPATLFDFVSEHFTLDEIREVYPDGVDTRHMNWMFNRLLEFMILTHSSGVIHGALLPHHIMVHAVSHGVVVIDWTASVLGFESRLGEHISVVTKRCREFYPPEVWEKVPANPTIDLYMAAMCAKYVLGCPLDQTVCPERMPPEVWSVLLECTDPDPSGRPTHLLRFYERYQKILRGIYGPRSYTTFTMPTATSVVRR